VKEVKQQRSDTYQRLLYAGVEHTRGPEFDIHPQNHIKRKLRLLEVR
jgi:hypothetical protein